MMTSTDFVAKALDIAKNHKTLYVMGCFGAPLTPMTKPRYCINHPYNRQRDRTRMILTAPAGTWGFDCVNLIKAILWGWRGDSSKVYGGARYLSNGVPDIGADGMIAKCPDASVAGWNHLDPGEVVWCSGHIGIYIGNGLAVECTPRWANGVQVTAVANMGSKAGYNHRQWVKHGHLPYISYTASTSPEKPMKEIRASGVARYRNRALRGSYRLCEDSVAIRDKAGEHCRPLTLLPAGARVTCYGYYSLSVEGRWLYVTTVQQGVRYTGFIQEDALRKVQA